MKTKLLYLFSAIGIAAMFASCSSTNQVASSFGKRKYMKGYYFDLPSGNNKVAKADADAKTVAVSTPVISAAALNNTNGIAVINSPEQTITQHIQPVHPVSHKYKALLAKKLTTISHDIKTLTPAYNPAKASAAAPLAVTRTASDDNVSTGSILGFVFGTIGLFLSWMGFGILFLILGLIFSAHARHHGHKNIFSLLGLIFSLVGLILWFILFLLLVVILASAV